jgi:hypothetical protein
MTTETPAPEADLVARLECGASTSTSVNEHIRKYQALCNEAAAEIRAHEEGRKVGLEEAAGEIAYQLTKRLVIDMPTARASVDAAIRTLQGGGNAE